MFKINEGFFESLPQFVLQVAILFRRAKRRWTLLDLGVLQLLQIGSSLLSVILMVSSLLVELPIYLDDFRTVPNKTITDLLLVALVNLFLITPKLLTLGLSFGCIDMNGWKSGLILVAAWLFTYTLFIAVLKKAHEWWKGSPNSTQNMELQAVAVGGSVSSCILKIMTIFS